MRTSFDLSATSDLSADASWLDGERASGPRCYHGGAFFEAVGDEFDALDRLTTVISADVLDAWFPPSPRVLTAMYAYLPLLVRTSPPTSCEGLARTIARTQGVRADNILCGGGSSDLIFLALTRWLTPASRVLILDPMYGEYAHVLEQVIGCRVDRLVLAPESNYALDPDRLEERLRATRYDLAILVNPNSPTGQHTSRGALERAIANVPPTTRLWIDETYVEYAGSGQSLERLAAERDGVVVCKSLSKVYALSGLRVGYLCASRRTIDALRGYNPPWAVGLVGQVAAVAALRDRTYYESRWLETHTLRRTLARELGDLGLEVVPGVANFLLCHLPGDGPDAATVVRTARKQDLFLRELGGMGRSLASNAIRVAVKDAVTNARIVGILGDVLSTLRAS
jgi:histidinol-phosphate/aromatic aminotransferase/cobyric acid decarboxylase-like protein